MLEYNTSLPKLSMREYGRHIQKLIDHCVSIPEREERTSFAYNIAEIMARLFPELSGEINERKLWDHINMISNYKLDIDFPCEVFSAQELRPKPQKIAYSQKNEKYRCYGSNLIRMIKEVSKMEGGVEKDQLIFLVANQMKKQLVTVNADTATDIKVFNDIREITAGGIDIDGENYRLNEYIGLNTNQNDTKKKKKK